MEDKYIKQRERMVDDQLIARGIKEIRVLDVFRSIPRHLFVNESYRSQAYEDWPIPIGEGQTISQPYIVAVMLELLKLRGHERVLEVGTGSGYQTALLATLGCEVYTIERIPSLQESVKTILKNLGLQNIYFKVGDGSQGWEEYGPYAGIIVSAGAPETPQPLLDQLEEGGRLVIPLGERSSQRLMTFTRKGQGFVQKDVMGCVFVPLLGDQGWKE
ncbi:MAG: protein-L-isoaspartate(D-aspartate) O-methyltransferase [Chlamydiae bacterium]|nr:protein-L-isoaspartate(D-aspartate) O-methyltransferase [Chlamydiota bacterium]MBI3278164.1 protein-L-isoaspartate(D-aspartate) O-methyltransferase [Chlamydiota bacterium]